MKKCWLIAAFALFATQANATIAELVDGVKHRDISAVQNLLKKGENVNATDKDGNTALHYAVAMDNAEMAGVLLASGADMNIENAKGWSPLKIAEQKKVPHVTEVLQNAMVANQKAEAKVEQAEQAVEQAKEAVKEAKEVVSGVPNLLQVAEQAKPEPVKAEAPKPEPVKPEVKAAPAKPEPTPAKSTKEEKVEIPADEIAVYKHAIEEAKQAVISAREAQNKAETANKELETEIKKLREQNKTLQERVTSQEKAAKAAEEKALKATKEAKEAKEKAEKEAKAKAEKAAKEKAAKEAKEKAAKEAKAKAEALKKAAEQAAKKPSALNPKIYAGDEEIVYCLVFLGNGENQNMKRAAGFYAAASSIPERRFNEIATQADMYYSTALEADLQKYNDTCGKIITPADETKQNMIIRSLNSSVGY
ncbi:MAG: ankyrin repeat domain-containing protein [Alphaproteobacteria bacterium]|nr:ankyrin repeat domain-containing protein [Alphaproteobacteria bacterium]